MAETGWLHMRGGMDLRRAAQLACGALLTCVAAAVAACTAGGSTPLPPNTLSLTQVQWCDTPSIAFQDDGKLSHTVLTDWNAVKDQLDFTPYLPASLPKGTCLALAGGTIHDPIFGGLFRITYYLPGSGPISFSEAPKSGAAAGAVPATVQCTTAASTATPGASPSPSASPTATPAPVLTVCLGTIAKTSITVAAAQSTTDLQKLFNALQPTQDWVPQIKATPTPKATITPSATAKP